MKMPMKNYARLEQLLRDIDQATDTTQMTKREAVAWIKEMINALESRIEALMER
jgi:hypothetical protein